MQDRFNFQTQTEHLHARYVGTGNPDTPKYVWNNHIHRDTLASHIGHHSRMVYFCTAENEPMCRLRYKFLTKMIQPCGPPPPDIEKAEF
ncbi:unnamed protein product [Paramecium primaurelia]|uniref:Splicing factor subunit n=5 Tax=Paramecium TaxID=5884 RepID=A0DS79_PARTE|nr:uncharacterized protein GSPATT00019600001 [Paramecium tetraurelia]CAD8084504.1 unnamed protein product [Paramecium primaurelia]CAD8099144.1 unnamed protein product [Paramecium sonneborni]CAD8181090.1 unnamed protein product [Paramecium octaurelia]CAD8183179.1 unnamed protein product [Paramecium pentaurelia]CAK85896.1 unnamed protein product [Paramecium tetraurelia]|eukprot:XP_001453293.1 hypothetical protein (macronuclear) [Paramecium tetraurelia strain d4-2]